MSKIKPSSNYAMMTAMTAMGPDRVDKGGTPYVVHLAAVLTGSRERCIAMGIPYDDEVAQAAILHDTAEDSHIKLPELESVGFSGRVLMLVDALTQREGELKPEYWQRILDCPDWSARAIKAADAGHNAMACRLGDNPTEGQAAMCLVYLELSQHMMDPTPAGLTALLATLRGAEGLTGRIFM